MSKGTQTERIADLMADNIILRGIVAHLLAKIEPSAAARESALERILTAVKPEIENHVLFYNRMNTQSGERELQRIRRRGGEIIELAVQLS
jgi:hypothetical protein